VVLDVCHGSKQRHFQYAKRVVPPVATWVQEDPLPEPWVSYVSDAKSFPTHFVTPSRPLLPPLHLPSSSVDVKGNPLAIVEQHLRQTNF
jgi:hypothetical protein